MDRCMGDSHLPFTIPVWPSGQPHESTDIGVHFAGPLTVLREYFV
ncbi:MAG: hypothetical protein ACOC53_02445 [Candidatus Saliniplasma sp.]